MGMMTSPKTLAALLAAGAVSYPSDAEAMYVGPKAKGWEGLMGKFTNLMDRMPRAEISDAGVNLNLPQKIKGDYKGWLADRVEHPELFEQYPFLKNLTVNLKSGIGNEGKFTAGSGMVGDRPWEGNILAGVGAGKMNEAETKRTTESLLHEIQHAIQEKEGWARGGNISEFNKGWNVSEGQRKIWQDEVFNKYRVAELFEKADKAGISPQQALAHESKTWGMDTGNARIKELLGAYKNKDEAKAMWLESKKQLDDYTKRTIMEPSEQYRRLSGEIESRDTAARMGLTSAQRLSNPPYSGQGIPLSDAITKMGVAAPVGAILAEQMAQKRAMAQKYEGGGVQEAVNPIEYLIPGRWGGGMMNMGIDALMQYFTGGK